MSRARRTLIAALLVGRAHLTRDVVEIGGLMLAIASAPPAIWLMMMAMR